MDQQVLAVVDQTASHEIRLLETLSSWKQCHTSLPRGYTAGELFGLLLDLRTATDSAPLIAMLCQWRQGTHLHMLILDRL